ncbi:MAG: hypothetical protein KDK99_08350 [Verrucomicrobiales bacterium]|nr:hypothetical protein [Verrucomicrobiales bacterium]
MADVLMWLLVAVAFVVAVPALWLLDRGLWPERFQRKRASAARGLLLSFLLGLIPAALVIAAAMALGKRLGFAALLLVGVALLWGFLGCSGLAARLGATLWPEAAAWRQSRNGGLVLMGCALLPVVGWIMLLPGIAILGMGLQIRSRLSAAGPTEDAESQA